MNNLKVKVGDRVIHKSTGSKMIIVDIKKHGVVEFDFDKSTAGGWKGSGPNPFQGLFESSIGVGPYLCEISYFEDKFEIDKQFNREQKINSLF